jgi:hypothetical protein
MAITFTPALRPHHLKVYRFKNLINFAKNPPAFARQYILRRDPSYPVFLFLSCKDKCSNICLPSQSPLNHHVSGVPPRFVVYNNLELGRRFLAEPVFLVILLPGNSLKLFTPLRR